MSTNQPQTVLMVVFGGARDPLRTFPHGTPVAPFSVGARGDWPIVAPGVEAVHFYMGFDGREVHVAQATPTSRVFLDGHELPAGWHNARVGAELRFGGACVTISNEERRATTQPFGVIEEAPPQNPGQQLRTQFIPRPAPVVQPQPAGFVPVQAAPHVQGVQGWQAIPPVATEPEGQFGSTAKLLPRSGAAAPQQAAYPQGAPPQAYPPQQAAYPQPPAEEIKLRPSPALVLGGTQLAAAPDVIQQHQPAVAPGVIPPHQLATLKSAEGALVGIRGPEAGHAAPAGPAGPAAPAPPGSNFAFDEKGPSTVADGGALRDHAARVAAATPSVAFASAQAYAAEVRRASGSTPVPAGHLAAPEPVAPLAPIAAPGASANPPPGYARASQAPAPDAELPAKPASGLAKSWREASLVKKITVALLPLGLAGVVMMPDEPVPAPESAEPTEAASASASASAAALPSAMANLAASAGSSASPPPSAAAAAASASAAAVGSASVAAGSASVAAASAGAAVGSAVPKQAASAAAVSIEIASARPSASIIPPERPLPATSERDAINAAFEGRNVEAATIYARIANAKGERVFSLAANLVRENIVLKPAISH